MKRIRTKFNAAMIMLAAFVLTLTGGALIINMSIDYRREFYSDVLPFTESIISFESDNVNEVCALLDDE